VPLNRYHVSRFVKFIQVKTNPQVKKGVHTTVVDRKEKSDGSIGSSSSIVIRVDLILSTQRPCLTCHIVDFSCTTPSSASADIRLSRQPRPLQGLHCTFSRPTLNHQLSLASLHPLHPCRLKNNRQIVTRKQAWLYTLPLLLLRI
jgi:hypothetical protein